MPTGWTLPAPVYDGYEVNPVDPSVRTDMEMGASRSRRRTFAINDQVKVTWKFTDSQMTSFRAWFDDDAAGGNAWVPCPLAIGRGGVTTANVRFVGGYKQALSAGLNWTVTATLEVR